MTIQVVGESQTPIATFSPPRTGRWFVTIVIRAIPTTSSGATPVQGS